MSQLGIKTKEEILELGIETFNAKCRESVLKYTGEWREYVTRQARWVDFDNDYKTLEPDYMESVIWAFKTLLRQGPGLRGLPRAALLLERPDAAVQPRAADGRRRLQEPPGPGRHRRPAPRDRRARPGLDDDAVDPAGQPRHHGRAPTSTTSSSSPTSPARPSATSRRGPPRGVRQGPVRPRRRRRADRVVERLKGSRPASAAPSRRRSPTTWATTSAHRVFAGRLRHDRGRHRPRPHRRRVR